MKRQILTSLRMLLVMTLLTGVLYPLIMTVAAQLLFPRQSNGSVMSSDRGIVGSELLAQRFHSDKYFWGRPSAAGYDPLPSGADNLGPTSRALLDSAEKRRVEFTEKNRLPPGTEVPPEMLFASGSGLDPHISPEAAYLQIDRIVRARALGARGGDALTELVGRHIEEPQFGFLGERRVNVLLLNLSLDSLK
jgi:K+-transporting ATPase ATPase C chain